MDETPLRLVKPDADSSTDAPRSSFRLNRRLAERHHLTGRVTAVCHLPSIDDQRKRICSLQLLNISDSGLGAISQDPLEPDSLVTVFFPAHGPERGFDAPGRVVRCTSNDFGFHLGIRFDNKAAA